MTAVATLVWGLICIWLFLTLVFQHTEYGRKLGDYSFARLLPRWTFFAPNPGVKDYHLAVRDRTPDNQHGAWHAISFGRDRQLTNIVWNPQKRGKKILSDAVQSLRVISSPGPNGVNIDSLSLPYLMLLRYSFEVIPINEPFVERQFAIFESTGHLHRYLEAAYISLYHGR